MSPCWASLAELKKKKQIVRLLLRSRCHGNLVLLTPDRSPSGTWRGLVVGTCGFGYPAVVRLVAFSLSCDPAALVLKKFGAAFGNMAYVNASSSLPLPPSAKASVRHLSATPAPANRLAGK